LLGERVVRRRRDEIQKEKIESAEMEAGTTLLR
jgi:hypothetical protein